MSTRDVEMLIDLKMNPIACCRKHAPNEGVPTFSITADPAMDRDAIRFTVITDNVESSLHDIRELGNLLEVLGHALIVQSEPLRMKMLEERS